MNSLFNFLSEERTMEGYMILANLALLFGIVALAVGCKPVLFFIGGAMVLAPLVLAAIVYAVLTIKETF